MILIGGKPPADREAIHRIKGWVRELFGLGEDDVVTVMELKCLEDDCPDVETVIGVLGEPGKARKHKLLKPAAEVSRLDIADLATRGTHG
jgi:hypothetical protein